MFVQIGDDFLVHSESLYFSQMDQNAKLMAFTMIS